MFQQPSQGDKINISDHIGSLVLIWVKDYREDIQTAFGLADAVAADVHVLDSAHGGEKFENTLIFQKALIGSLRNAVGGDPVLGRIGQGVAKPGQSAPYILQPFTDADAALATEYIQRMPKPFQAPAGSGGPTTPAPGAPPATPPPTAGAAVAATAPAASNGMTPETFAALPPEVQELLRQSGQVPA